MPQINGPLFRARSRWAGFWPGVVREAHAAGASYGSEAHREGRSNLAADWEGWGRKFQFVNGLKPGQLT